MPNNSIISITNNELCTGCGVCVSESNGNLKIKKNEFGFLVPELINEGLTATAIKVCPFNPNPDKEIENEDKLAAIFLKETQNSVNKIGRYENLYVGYSNEYRNTSSSGGIASYIFERLLKEKLVDYLYIVKEVEGNYEYQLFSHVDEIRKISKTRYIPVTLEQLFLNIDTIQGKIAISGVACFIKAIRLKHYYNPGLKQKIPFLVGIICGGLKSSFFTDYLAQKAGIEQQYKKQDYRIKDKNSLASDYSFGAYNENDDFKQVKMKTIGDMWGTGMFKSNACDFCTDVTTELADISLGDAWMHPYDKEGLGNSIVITRTSIADNLIKKGIRNKELSLDELSLEKLLLSQKGSFNHRHIGLGERIRIKKKQNKLLPSIRHIQHTTPLDFALVQKHRMVVREKSLEIWLKTKNVIEFDKLIETHLEKLNFYTKIYHYKYKIKSKIDGIFMRVIKIIYITVANK